VKPYEVVVRARRVSGKGCQYVLGAGGMHPESTVPWNQEMACDCSGFAMWCLGLSRKQGDLWYGTDEIVHDATHESEPLFMEVSWVDVLPGDLLVWPGSEGHHGHVGVVSTINPHGPDTVVHCSLGNFKNTGDAIRETPPELFMVRQAIVARCNALERDET
jgi:hypothetical protein